MDSNSNNNPLCWPILINFEILFVEVKILQIVFKERWEACENSRIYKEKMKVFYDKIDHLNKRV